MEKLYTFVLKDKGTGNEGWWLKISNADELADYYEKDQRINNVMTEYINNEKHKSQLTEAIEQYSANRKLTIWQGATNFTMMVAEKQLECIRKYGAIYINCVGGYHMMSKDDVEYATVKRNCLRFPKEGEIVEEIEIKISEKTSIDEEYGFLSPNGKFFDGEWSTHADLAREIIKDNGWELENVYEQNAAINYLVKRKGYILVHNPSRMADCLVVQNKNENITDEQKDFLYKYFINNGNPWRAEDYK